MDQSQNKRQRQVLSCHGFQKDRHRFTVPDSMVFLCNLQECCTRKPIGFANIRTAHKGVRARYTGGILPKRPGLDRIKIKNPGAMMKSFSN